MRTVLCFGDSNTYGQMPGFGAVRRFGSGQRWPGVMRRALGAEWLVVEEGLSGRTTVHDDPLDGKHKNGRRYITACLQSHAPLDAILLMLGTNDMKARFSVQAQAVADGVAVLVREMQQCMSGPGESAPEIFVLAPAQILPDRRVGRKSFTGAVAKSKKLTPALRTLAQELQVHFFDIGTVVVNDPADGIHLGESGHRALGDAMAQKLLALFAQK